MYSIDGDLQGLVDTHCHLDLEPLCSDLPKILDVARRAGVTRFVLPGVHPDGWERILCLARLHDGIYPAFGIHPMHADIANGKTLSRLSEFIPHGVAIGEIGLDPSYAVPMELQERAFRAQLQCAVSSGLPVLVHCRRAFQKTLQILIEENVSRVGGIMHAFSGSVEMAKEFIQLGFAISLSGTVTWETATRPVRLAREIPMDSLVLETDAPDLAPCPFRGQPNQPAFLMKVLATVAQIRDVTPDFLSQATEDTSQRILRLHSTLERKNR